MKQAKFAFIIFATLVQLIVILHSQITTYVEQQYHNFTESSNPFTQFLGTIYQATMLQDYAIFTYADSAMAHLEQAFNNVANDVLALLDVSLVSETKIESSTEKPQKHTDSKPTQEVIESHISSTEIPAEIQSQAQQERTSSPQEAQILPNEPLPTQDIKNAEEKAGDENIESASSSTPPAEPNFTESYTPIKKVHNPRIEIDENDKVLLVGDSMMQGIAPYMLKTFKKLNLKGINLSKHSTGLTYPHYFNWAEAITQAFATYDNIAIVVVILGANDPWSMKKNIAFKSQKWEKIYTQRINDIITIAQSNGARVVWYEVPSVREKSLNDKILYLNSLYEREVRASGEFFLQSNGIVTQGGAYSAFIKNKNGKSIQVRIDDGVHFTSRGYQIMANIFLNTLVVSPQETLQDSESTESALSFERTTEAAINDIQTTQVAQTPQDSIKEAQ